MEYTRNMQKAIYALLYDLSEHYSCSPPAAEALLKKQYWGDRDGVFSLSLDKCSPHNARGFYRFLLELALRSNIEFCTWSSKQCPPRSPLEWGFDKKDLIEMCESFNINPFNFTEFKEVFND